MTADVLAAVVASAKRSAEERARSHPLRDLERAAASRVARPGAFRAALEAPGVRVVAECKRRSPSKGVLRATYDPVTIAHAYATAGAAAISVLTEATFFDGSLDHLRAVRDAVRLPVLRKDFVVTDIQVVEAREAGADAVLLIVAALEQPALVRLLARAREWQLDALVEVHDRDELARAIDAGASIVGVNSRNLRTLAVESSAFEEVAPALPAGAVAVAESGLGSGRDLQRLRAMGYRAFLIGERLMAAPDPGRALTELLRDAEAPA